ncbi:DNA-binding transcriptional LysR family regulator [Mycoplana sp. BE70]|uniref:LysR substrate-binding domain-containing protein n=1 Tax=Mycoplana sp. BE70 TaxID=2817775 RepID=UPI00285EADD2|nr:DNA-binding transcriptional LysR family regulator [Mycoplana sp. BE70]
MAPLLPKFYALFPHIKIRLLAAVWADTSASVDVDIRFGDGQWSDFEVRPLWREPSVLVARKDDTVLQGDEREKLLTLLQGGVPHKPTSDRGHEGRKSAAEPRIEQFNQRVVFLGYQDPQFNAMRVVRRDLVGDLGLLLQNFTEGVKHPDIQCLGNIEAHEICGRLR